MFALDRRYIMYSITAEKLKSVGWKYFELSDMFSKKTHKENWVSFWNEVEKIKKLQMVAEFTDHDDKTDNKDDDLTIEDKKPFEYDSDDSSNGKGRNMTYQYYNFIKSARRHGHSIRSMVAGINSLLKDLDIHDENKYVCTFGIRIYIKKID